MHSAISIGAISIKAVPSVVVQGMVLKDEAPALFRESLKTSLDGLPRPAMRNDVPDPASAACGWTEAAPGKSAGQMIARMKDGTPTPSQEILKMPSGAFPSRPVLKSDVPAASAVAGSSTETPSAKSAGATAETMDDGVPMPSRESLKTSPNGLPSRPALRSDVPAQTAVEGNSAEAAPEKSAGAAVVLRKDDAPVASRASGKTVAEGLPSQAAVKNDVPARPTAVSGLTESAPVTSAPAAVVSGATQQASVQPDTSLKSAGTDVAATEPGPKPSHSSSVFHKAQTALLHPSHKMEALQQALKPTPVAKANNAPAKLDSPAPDDRSAAAVAVPVPGDATTVQVPLPAPAEAALVPKVEHEEQLEPVVVVGEKGPKAAPQAGLKGHNAEATKCRVENSAQPSELKPLAGAEVAQPPMSKHEAMRAAITGEAPRLGFAATGASHTTPVASTPLAVKSAAAAEARPSVEVGVQPTDLKTLTATPNVLEVGVASGSHGWLRVRAELGPAGEVAASVAASSAGAAEGLHKELPAISAYLAEERVGVGSLTVHAMERGSGAQDSTLNTGSGGAPGSQAGAGQRGKDWNPPNTRSESGFVEGESYSDVDEVSQPWTMRGIGSGGWVSVRV